MRRRQLLQTGLADYEKVYRLQPAYFDKLNGHARGELLFGLAEGYLRAGDQSRARQWFEKLAAVDDPENGHLKQAKEYLESGNLAGTRSCVGCHVGSSIRRMKALRRLGRIMVANIAAAAILPVFLVLFGRERSLPILLKQFSTAWCIRRASGRRHGWC